MNFFRATGHCVIPTEGIGLAVGLAIAMLSQGSLLAEAAEKDKAHSNLAAGDIHLLEKAGGRQGKLKANGTPTAGSDWFGPLKNREKQYRDIAKAQKRELDQIRKTRRSLMEELGKTEPTTPSAKRVRGR